MRHNFLFSYHPFKSIDFIVVAAGSLVGQPDTAERQPLALLWWVRCSPSPGPGGPTPSGLSWISVKCPKCAIHHTLSLMATENISVSPTMGSLESLFRTDSLLGPGISPCTCAALFAVKDSGFLLCAAPSSSTILANFSPFVALTLGLLFLLPWFGFYFPVLWFGKPPGRRPE